MAELAPEVLADWRKRALAASACDPLSPQWAAWNNIAVPATVLTLLDRIAELEAAVPRCGCGSTVSVRGDAECDACGKDCYYCTCPKKGTT